MQYFFKSLNIDIQTGHKANEIEAKSWIQSICKKMGKSLFRELVTNVFEELEIEFRNNIQLKDFLNDPIIRKFPKVGNNEFCPCGSGKKYKKCHKTNNNGK